jgi:hypothetical protein
MDIRKAFLTFNWSNKLLKATDNDYAGMLTGASGLDWGMNALNRGEMNPKTLAFISNMLAGKYDYPTGWSSRKGGLRLHQLSEKTGVKQGDPHFKLAIANLIKQTLGKNAIPFEDIELIEPGYPEDPLKSQDLGEKRLLAEGRSRNEQPNKANAFVPEVVVNPELAERARGDLNRQNIDRGQFRPQERSNILTVANMFPSHPVLRRRNNETTVETPGVQTGRHPGLTSSISSGNASFNIQHPDAPYPWGFLQGRVPVDYMKEEYGRIGRVDPSKIETFLGLIKRPDSYEKFKEYGKDLVPTF